MRHAATVALFHMTGGRSSMRRYPHQRILAPALLAMLLLAISLPPIAVGSPAEQGTAPREIEVAVGGGQDTMQLLAMFPQILTIRAGDTLTWHPRGGEIHTVTF